MNKIYAFKWTLLIVLTRILDGYTTYLATPDLNLEENPIIKFFELDWRGTILLGLILITLTICLFYYAIKNSSQFNIKANKFGEYVSLFFFSEKLNFVKLLYRIPKLKPSLIFIGIVFPISLVFYSILISLNNLFIYLIHINVSFYQFYSNIYEYYNLVIWLGMIVIITAVSYKVMKKQYFKAQIKLQE